MNYTNVMKCQPGCSCGKHPFETVEDRFWAKVDKSGECWLWMGAHHDKGYGRFWNGTRVVPAHQFSYELAGGLIPKGWQLDHQYTCPKNCVNPSHLRTATSKQQKENQSGVRSDNTSGTRGVYWSKSKNCWHAQVGHYGKRHHIGYFSNKEAAETAVITKRNELFTYNDIDRG